MTLPSIAALAAALCGLACQPPPPPRPLPTLSPEVAEVAYRYAGCWELTFDRGFPGGGIGQQVAVVLDTVVIGSDPKGPALLAEALDGFTNGRQTPFALVWQPRLPPDSSSLSIRSTSGVTWRFVLTSDSLIGRSFEYWDLGPTETDAGPMSGHRLVCPRPVE